MAYYDHVHSTINVVAVCGGAPTQISATPGSNFTIFTEEKAVLVWTNLDAANVGTLVVWTADDGLHTLSTTSLSPQAAVDASSTYVVYETSVNEASSTGNVVGSRTDGSGGVTLVTGATTPGFILAGNYAVVNYALGTELYTQSFALETWASTVITTSTVAGTQTLEGVDSAGTKVLVLDPSNSLNVFPIAGSTATLIASGVTTATLGASAMFAPTGAEVYFAGGGGATLDKSVSTASAVDVLANGTNLSLYGLAPNLSSMIAYGGGTPASNVYFQPTSGLAPLAVLTPAMGFGGALYTNDSSHVLFFSDYSEVTGIGSLHSLATAAGTSSLIDASFATVGAYGASKAVLTDNVTTTTADLKVFDAASTAAPTLIAASVQSFTASATVPTVGWGFAFMPESTSVVYFATAQAGRVAGIYVTALP